MNKDLDNYIHDQLAQGVSNSAIKQALLAAGWKEEDVDAALRSAASSTANKDSAAGAVTAHTTVDHPHIAEQPVAEKPHSSDGHSRKLIVFGAVAAVIVLILAGAGFRVCLLCFAGVCIFNDAQQNGRGKNVHV
jgi:hypothetical protein